MRRVHISRRLRRFGEVLAKAGHEAWLVGGAVRDLLQRRGMGDCDVATDATPETVRRLFRRTYPTGIRHGTVTSTKMTLFPLVRTSRDFASPPGVSR